MAAYAYEGALTRFYGLGIRELAILKLIVNGMTDQQIAGALHVPLEVVLTDTARILRKMDAHSRTEAAIRAMREGMGGLHRRLRTNGPSHTDRL
jgi:DNA-binding NarL/FixJ family response regulator